MQNVYNCRIGKVTPKDGKVVVYEKALPYQTEADVVEFAREFFNVLRDERVLGLGFIYETADGTGSTFIKGQHGLFSTLIAQCDVLKHKLIISYLS